MILAPPQIERAMKIEIGKRIEENTLTNHPVYLDVKSLVYSRALVQANSGGGKSGLIRVIAEQVAAKIPTIIIDREGEFHTLREKIDLVLVGEQGELPADVRSAGLLARKLVEVSASAVIDLSSFTKAAPQQDFVAAFLDALINLPKKLWRPTFIIIDEAQFFAPERSFGESSAGEAVVNLMTLGRKRGFCGILCTPRIAAINKNAANVNNVFIGRTQLDTDQSRAGRDLGMKPKDAIVLRELEQRHFYAFGPDLGFKGVMQFRVADCQTTIPKPGMRKSLTPPKASHVVEKLAAKLADLPQLAEVEIRDMNMAKARIRELERSVKDLKAGTMPRERDAKLITDLETRLKAKESTRTEEVKALRQAQSVITNLKNALGVAMKFIANLDARGIFDVKSGKVDDAEVEKAVKTVVKQLQAQIDKSLGARGRELAGLRQEAERLIGQLKGIAADDKLELKIKVTNAAPTPTPKTESARPPREPSESNGNVPPARQKILDSLAWLETVGIKKADRIQLALFAGTRPTSGAYKNNLGALRTAQLLDYPEPNFVSLTEDGRAQANVPEAPATVDELHARLKEMLPPAKWKILEVLIPVYPNSLSREDLVKEINDQGGKAEVTSGAFKNNLGSLRSLGVISYPQSNHVAARSVLFLEQDS